MIHHRTAFMALPSDERYMPILGKGHKGFPLPSFHIQRLIANCPINRDHLYPAEAVVSLYLHRWESGVRLHAIKTTLGMEMLRTKIPGIVGKELQVHQTVYNLMRVIMLKVANDLGVNLGRLGFRGVQQVVAAKGPRT
jgi:hypothetical protein